MNFGAERPPVYGLTLNPAELGRYDEDGSIREGVWQSSARAVGEYALQPGYTGEEADAALDELARELRRVRGIRRRQKAQKL